MRKLVNFAAFQALWFWCVIGTPRLDPVLVVLVALALTAWLISSGVDRVLDLVLALAVAVLGLAVDSVEIGLGSFDALGLRGASFLSPWWFVILWAGFATTLTSSFGWVRGRPIVAALLGLVFGPISYASAERLGALTLGAERGRSLVAIGIGWAIAMIAALELEARIRLWRSRALAADAVDESSGRST